MAKDSDDWDIPPLLRDEGESEGGGEGGEGGGEEGGIGPLKKLDYIFDSWMSKYAETTDRSLDLWDEAGPEVKRRAHGAVVMALDRKRAIDETGERTFRRFREVRFSLVTLDFVLKHSALVIVALLLLTGLLAALGMPNIQKNIRGDLEVYLPQGDKVSEDLNAVREHWSTDLIVIYCESNNAYDTMDNTNITSVAVLREMSDVETKLKSSKEHGGLGKDALFLFSISTLIKEVNATPGRVGAAIANETNLMQPVGLLSGGYSIPDQGRVDQIIAQLPPDTRESIVKDTNGDGIYDSAAIMIGLKKGVNQEKDIDIVKKAINLWDPLQNDHWDRDYNSDKVHLKMSITGPVPMIQSITQRTYNETSRILPIAFMLLCVVLLYFHRTWKILAVIWLPVIASLGMTFGILGILDIPLTPQVVFVAPVLLALGLAYGLYIANRYSEESDIDDKEERIRSAVKHTSRPIFLSAVTTSFGFGSLMTAQMLPLQVLGFGLAIGILICYALTMLMTPAIVLWLDYREESTGSWRRVGDIPVNNRKKLIVGALALVLFSTVWALPQMRANMDYIAMSPQDDPVVVKMYEFGEKFGNGQIGMLMIEGNRGPMSDDKPEKSMRDINVLNDINDASEGLKGVDYTTALSIVDIMKSITVNLTIPVANPTDPTQVYELHFNGSYWDAINKMNEIDSGLAGRLIVLWTGKTATQIAIDVFYNSISDEMRSMIVTRDYSRTLIYIFQPSLDTATTKKLVNEINRGFRDPRIWDNGERVSEFTGTGAIMVRVNDLLMLNSYQSLAVALILVFLILTFVFDSSIKFAAVTIIPVVIVVAIEPLSLMVIPRINPLTFHLMSWGIELNLFTAIIASVIVGLGIDFSIHITERVREGKVTLESVKSAVNTSGRSFTEATISMIVGLATIFIVPIQSMWEFVELIILLLVFSVLGALLILPSVYAFIIKDLEKRDWLLRDMERKGRGLRHLFSSRGAEEEQG